MSKIPDYIRNVKIPIQSEVKNVNGIFFVNLYSSKRGLKKRDGTIRKKPGKVTGPRIGRIDNLGGEYIFRPNKYYANLLNNVDEDVPTDKEYGASKVLFDELRPSIKKLDSIFGSDNTSFLITYSILRLIYKNIKCHQLERKYLVSYISELIKGVSLSKNTISATLESIGKHPERFQKYMIDNITNYSNLAIDGTLLATETKSNSLVCVGRKDKGVFHNQINLVYVFDYEEKMPKYYEYFSGNTTDITAFTNVYKNINLKEGIIIGDRMFSAKSARNQLVKDSIDYLFPLKKSDKYYKSIANDHKKEAKKYFINGCFYLIKYKRISKTRYLTYFKDLAVSDKKEREYLENLKDKKAGYSKAEYEEIKETFGVYVYESNRKYKADKVVNLYKMRWQIEEMNDEYMNDLEMDELSVQGTYRANTMFFINHLSLHLYYQLKNKKEKVEELRKKADSEILDELKDIRIVKERNKWHVKNLTKRAKILYSKLGFNL
jgi:ribosomal protein L15